MSPLLVVETKALGKRYGSLLGPSRLLSCLADATKTATKAKSDCFDRYGIVQNTIVTYQPADRFWLFQAIEASIFAGLALALFGLARRELPTF